MGENVSKLKVKFPSYLVKNMVMVNSGSSALLLAFESLRAFNNSKKIKLYSSFNLCYNCVFNDKMWLQTVFVDVNVDTMYSRGTN